MQIKFYQTMTLPVCLRGCDVCTEQNPKRSLWTAEIKFIRAVGGFRAAKKIWNYDTRM